MKRVCKKSGVVLACALVCCLSLQAVNPLSAFAAGTAVIRIGALVDQTGGSTSPLYRAAVELAGNQMNQALADIGSPVVFEIVFADTKSTAQLAQDEAVRLVNEEGVKAMVSATSGETIMVNQLNYDPASPVKYQFPLACFMCSSGFINNPEAIEEDAIRQAAERDLENWLVRVFYIANYEAAVQVQVALGQKTGKGPFKVGIFADVPHRSLATSVADTLPTFSADASAEITYFTKLENLGADWETVVGTQPDVVIVAMLPQAAAEAVKAYREAGYTIPILSNNSFRRNYILAGMGEVANGLEGSSVQLADSGESGQAFLRAFQEATGELPEMTSSGAYDATVSMMLAALVAAHDVQPQDVTSADIRQGLLKINDPEGEVIRPTVQGFGTAATLVAEGNAINYEGAYDSLDWDEVGNMFPLLVHWKVENGRFVEYDQYQCNPENPRCPVK